MRLLLLALTALTLPLHADPKFDPAPMNDLGLRAMREATWHDGQGVTNRLTSPVALYQALSMATNGAAGATRAAMAQSLNVVDDLEALNQSNELCRTLLTSVEPANKFAPRVRISNAAWDKVGEPKFEFDRAYSDALKRSFDARIATIDFKDPGSADVVNTWSKEVSDGLLPKIMSADELKKLLFLLVNVTYFEGKWGAPFRRIGVNDMTRDMTRFTLADGGEKHVPVIQGKGFFAHLKSNDEEIVELPFTSGNDQDYVFYAVLPAPGRPPAQYWDEAFWKTLPQRLAKSEHEKGLVRLPVFSFDYNVKLRDGDPLTAALGIEHMFKDSADFSAMGTDDSRPAKVGLIKEVARVELDENGVKAAAAVAIGGIETTSIDMGPAYTMVLDRPFAFAIAEKSSGALLFLGELQNPAQ